MYSGMAKNTLASKELVVFDLDGTLTESKAPIKADMVRMLAKLLEKKFVAVIGGGSHHQFKKQFISGMKLPERLLERLYLFPVSGTAFYDFHHGEKKVYARDFSPIQKKKIVQAFHDAFRETHYRHPQKTYGRVIEDRGSQVTFSAVGQDVVEKLGIRRGLAVKEEWNRTSDVRPKLMRALKRRIPRFTVRRGGLTSIDVTKFGIDKAYGIKQIRKELGIPVKAMVFVGDALYPGGNDAAVKKTGIQTIMTSGPRETMKIIKNILSVQ